MTKPDKRRKAQQRKRARANRDDPVLELVNRAKSGKNREAVGKLLELARPSILGVCRKFYLQQADVDDVVQEVNVKVVEHLPMFRYRSAAAFKAWAARIARNGIITHRRKHSRLSSCPVALENAARGDDPAVVVEATDTLQSRRRAIDSLSPEHRHCTLLFLAGYSIGAIAVKLGGIPPGTVASRLHTARRKLKEICRRVA